MAEQQQQQHKRHKGSSSAGCANTPELKDLSSDALRLIAQMAGAWTMCGAREAEALRAALPQALTKHVVECSDASAPPPSAGMLAAFDEIILRSPSLGAADAACSAVLSRGRCRSMGVAYPLHTPCKSSAPIVKIFECVLARGGTSVQALDIEYGLVVMDSLAKEMLCRVVRANRLREIRLDRCRIAHDACEALGQVLAATSSALRVLVIDTDFSVEDAGGELLAKGLAHNSTLTTLGLVDCMVDFATCSAIAVALAFQRTALRTLDLRRNEGIDARGVLAFAESLRHNATLTSLNLKYCGEIDDPSCDALREALVSGASVLRHIDMSKTYASPQAQDMLAEVVRRRRTR